VFNCTACHETIGPKVSPVLVPTGVRNVDYLNIVRRVDENDVPYKQEVRSVGTEIIAEARLCYKCAGTVPQQKPVVEIRGSRFQEPLADPLRVKLAAVAVDNVLSWLDQRKKNKRTERDIAAAAPLLKRFVELNPNTI